VCQDLGVLSVKRAYVTFDAMQITRVFLLLGLVLAAPVQADIYKYVDENGQVTFTDVYRKGAARIDLPGAPTPLPAAAGKAPRRASYSPSPANFPRIDASTQKNRDDIRRQVLQDEMDGERRNADTARKQLQLGERVQPGEKVTDSTYLDRVKRLQAAVSRHEQNIASIQRELANLK